MRLVCISAAHTPYNGELMEKSAQRVGVEIVRFKEGEPWPNDFRVGKLVHGLECIRQLPEDVTHVMFVDSSDTLFLVGPEEIVARFEDMRVHGIQAVVSGEKNCYPIAELADEFKSQFTPWHFVNSGSWILRREDAERVLQHVAAQADYCDQLCWSKAYLDSYKHDGRIFIDQECRLFQSMYLQTATDFEMKDGWFHNRVTRSAPAVLHWNGTRNQGVPFSRDGVWCALDPSHQPETPKAPPTICVAMPGPHPTSFEWVFGWSELYVNLVNFFGISNVRLVSARGNNIYQVRENCVKFVASNPPDYFLWLDADNPPTAHNFALIWDAINKNPAVSTIGAWYRFANEETGEVLIAAGKMGEQFKNITEEEILAAEHLIQVPFIGFGMCLMKWQVIKDIGVEKCFEPYRFSEEQQAICGRTWATDDSGFFQRATEAGHRTFLHPAAFVHHEKQMNIPGATLGVQIPALKEL